MWYLLSCELLTLVEQGLNTLNLPTMAAISLEIAINLRYSRRCSSAKEFTAIFHVQVRSCIRKSSEQVTPSWASRHSASLLERRALGLATPATASNTVRAWR